MTSNKKPHQIFYDPKGRRKKGIRLTLMLISITITALAAIFIIRVITLPAIPQLNPKQGNNSLIASGTDNQEQEIAPHRTLTKHRRRPFENALLSDKASFTGSQRNADSEPIAIGFYVNWDISSYPSLERNLAELDLLVPQWLRIGDSAAPVVTEIDQKVVELVRSKKPHLPIIPLIHHAKEGKWDVSALVHAIENKANRQKLIATLAQLIADNKWQGICIDFEQVPKEAHPNLLRFMRELYALSNQQGWLLMQVVPFDDPEWNYPAYADVNDYLMLMAYDEHWEETAPGSVCSQPWFQKTLKKRMQELAPDKTIVCIGGYGYEWGEQNKAMTFRDAMLAAIRSGARINFDRTELNPYFKYEADGIERHVWFLDAVTAYNQMLVARKYGVAGFALWRLGSEDTSLWSIFGTTKMGASPEVLREIPHNSEVETIGKGEFLRVLTGPKTGARSIEIDATDKLITTNQYQTYPSSYVLELMGYKPGLVALTFDDGPDREWTPRILDILKKEQVKAAFFIIGKNAQKNPDVVRRIVNEGHEIGNHSFTHPTLNEIPMGITRMELNASRLLIEFLTGRTTRLFRPPYFGGEPTVPEKVKPIQLADELGYLTVGSRIDSRDFESPGVEAIVKNTVAGVTSTDPWEQGQIVLLHDGGADRSQTIEALPQLIHELRSRGYRFAPIWELTGLTRDQVMLPVQKRIQSLGGFYMYASALSFYALSYGGWLMRWLFLIGIVLGVSRVIFISSLAFAQWLQSRKRERPGAGKDYDPFVSVIVPAYNEEKVIAQTIECLLASTYRNLEILVVDDGSTDRTSEVVSQNFNQEPRVRLFRTVKGSKAEALRYGLRHAKGEIIVWLDADTIFEKETIGLLARHFADPHIGAVAGNVKVGNRKNMITRFQALEYITSQNLDRRAYSRLNCITIIPGAVGACRRSLIDICGGWDSDTLAEDQELTLKIRRLGYQIVYEEEAISWTEAPETVSDLVKQRFRWSFGTLQCMWKHRDALFKKRYGALGFIAMPDVWIFQVLFSLISPAMDLIFIWALSSAAFSLLGPIAGDPAAELRPVIGYYCLFFAFESLMAVLAFAMERREQWKLLCWLCLQRICYRPVIYYVMVKSVLAALSGALVGWRKVERQASVVARGIPEL
jgi:peptidoglycan-N-acetylglucosamine deacetylase